ncbi:MAG TPA: hypothetical protein PKD25_02760, partial [Rubrivivax sp.]|nr:hypothetical protein [Rubrivivax sp.]
MHATARGRHAAGMPPAARRGAARAARRPRREGLAAAPSRVWLFDLDNTLHNASASAFAEVNAGMTRYIVEHLGLAEGEADALRRDYWLRYGATLLGLVRHHAVHAPHFLHATHRLPQLEARVHGHRHDSYFHPNEALAPFPVICAGSATQTGFWSYKEYFIVG